MVQNDINACEKSAAELMQIDQAQIDSDHRVLFEKQRSVMWGTDVGDECPPPKQQKGYLLFVGLLSTLCWQISVPDSGGWLTFLSADQVHTLTGGAPACLCLLADLGISGGRVACSLCGCV